MEQELQKANHYNRLAEWVQRVVLRTRYPGVHILQLAAKSAQAVTTEAEVCFTEISARPAGRGTAASIESGELRIEIHAGADAETVRVIIQALKEC